MSPRYLAPSEPDNQRFGQHEIGHSFLTDDLGFLRGGELYVVGRRSDVIILNGQNVFPQDLEHTASSVVSGGTPNSACVFEIDDGPYAGVQCVQEIALTTPKESQWRPSTPSERQCSRITTLS